VVPSNGVAYEFEAVRKESEVLLGGGERAGEPVFGDLGR
jgi:hypothetical protein